MDRSLPLSTPCTGAEAVADQLAQPRGTMALFAAFLARGLALTMAGLYSVLSYLVSMRRREIGIRMALGARPVPLAFAIVAVLLGSAARAACVVPARRASSVPPTESMR